MKNSVYVLYDGSCSLCRRTTKFLTASDVFGRLKLVNARDRADIETHGFGRFSEETLAEDMHVAIGEKVWRGFDGYRQIARHLPALWLLVPFLWVWPLSWLGRRWYRHVADTRSCELPHRH